MGALGASRRPSAAVVGGVSWNQVIDVPRLPQGRTETLFATAAREGIGATGSGKALNLARLGFATRLHALVGDDPEGDRAAAELADAGVDLTRVTDPAGTERHVNLMDPAGRRASVYVNGGTHDPDDSMVSAEELAAFTVGADYVWVNLANYARRVLPALAAADTPVWVDVHDWDGEQEFHRDFVAAARYLFLSDEALDDAVGFAGHLARSRELVVVTHGSRGATALLPGHEPLFVPPVEVDAVDPNGAGDAFCAGVAYGHSRGWDWPRSLRAGAAVAAGCVASPHLADPTLDEQWLERQVGVRA
ncbi:carbohydrate kinase family protein [Knoellia sp. p5-6-4]|uniref:carbohydrate kinase family protein n=1 Tax=unclassified Knoellia TaxID=2618719 RepID=UPI0023D9A012|nr:PfkB family carbohydrate kinase [Knoellia sp. p5-6-4]MDF2145005.1 PfkB family carbohydrate kinase [Knoellia sp. p5-6-4]